LKSWKKKQEKKDMGMLPLLLLYVIGGIHYKMHACSFSLSSPLNKKEKLAE